MNAREFFYLVARMRDAQRTYFRTRDQAVFRACRKLETDVDVEINRVKALLEDLESNEPADIHEAAQVPEGPGCSRC